MRILRLDSLVGAAGIDLHPLISVVHGLDQNRCDALEERVRSLVAGTGAAVSGLVEHRGQLMELTADSPRIGLVSTEDVVVNLDRVAGGAELIPQLRSERDHLLRTARIDAVAVEQVRADLMPAAAATVQRLRERVAHLIDAQGGTGDRQQIWSRIRHAVDSVNAQPATISEMPDDVASLLQEWNELRQVTNAAEMKLRSLDQRVDTAEHALTDARRFYEDAVADARPLLLSPEDEERLEELSHPRVEGRRFRGKDRSEEDAAEIGRLLAKVQQPSYAAYAMYRLRPEPPQEKRAIVEAAALQVQQAEAELAAALEQRDHNHVMAEISDRSERLKDQARLFLGAMLPADIGTALAALAVERSNPHWEIALEDLVAAIEETGLDYPESFGPPDLLVWAEEWLDRERYQLDLEPSDSIDELEASLRNAEALLDRHTRAMGRIDRLEVQAEASRELVRSLSDQLERLEIDPQPSVEVVVEAITRRADAVRVNAGSAAPILLVGSAPALRDDQIHSLLDALEDLVQDVQLILVTDREAAADWARVAGVQRAFVS